MKRGFFNLLIGVIACSSYICFAATIDFQDGTKIEGKIVEVYPDRISLNIDNTIRNYDRNEIIKIERDSVQISPAIGNGIIPTKRELILNLMEADGARASMTKIFSQIIAQTPKEREQELKNLLKVDEIIDILVPLYDQYYTEEEITQLITFYQSTLGQKLLQVTPKIMQQTIEIVRRYFQQKMPTPAQ